jgi:hypothetical protein
VVWGSSAQLLPSSTDAPQLDPVQLQMSQAIESDKSINVVPFEFDPFDTRLVQSSWLSGIGCPTLAEIAVFTPTGAVVPGTYADGACPTGDPRDSRFEGLLLAKTGPTANFASAGARLNGVKGIVLAEIGYDIRKPGINVLDPRGSHCGAGAPRFNITIGGTTYFVGCNSPAPLQTTTGQGWIRLRWPAAVLAATLGSDAGQPVDSISIIFDEGQDAGPDNFGMAGSRQHHDQ